MGLRKSDEVGGDNVLPFHRLPRLQNLSDDQIARLLRLLALAERIEETVAATEALSVGCPVARSVLGR